MKQEKEYKKYVKREVWNDFEKFCKINSTDGYSKSVLTSAKQIMKKLMQHEGNGSKLKKLTPKKAWEEGLGDEHSAMSASITAVTVAQFSPRGEEFKRWCIKKDIVMVDWGEKK